MASPIRLHDVQSPAVVFREVSRRYPSSSSDVLALDNVSFTLARGDFIAVTGPSGSGKTTLLNIAGGIDRATSGEVTVLGQTLTELPEGKLTDFRARCVGLVFQEAHLLPGLPALDNVIAGSIARGSWQDLVPAARQLLTAVGLAPRMDFVPAALSAGERQRVAIARALLGERPLLLADEPTGNLDGASTDDLMRLLVQLREERELTVVIATHDPVVAAYATRILRLVDGEVAHDQVVPEGLSVEQHEL